MKRKKTSDFNHAQVLRYWSKRLQGAADHVEIAYQVGRTNGKQGPCWACGADASLERCHIQPMWRGGKDILKNIHLLCHSCHKDSEDLTKDHYWHWFLNMNWVVRSTLTLLKRDSELAGEVMGLLWQHRPGMMRKSLVRMTRALPGVRESLIEKTGLSAAEVDAEIAALEQSTTTDF